MLVVDATCEVQHTSFSVRDHEGDIGRLEYDRSEDYCDSSKYYAEATTLECDLVGLLRSEGCEETMVTGCGGADTMQSGPMLLPGAWAMGEGVLLDAGDKEGRCHAPCSAGGPDCVPPCSAGGGPVCMPPGGLFAETESWAAAVGSYLANLAGALVGYSPRPLRAYPYQVGAGAHPDASDPHGSLVVTGPGDPPSWPGPPPDRLPHLCCTKPPCIPRATKKDN